MWVIQSFINKIEENLASLFEMTSVSHFAVETMQYTLVNKTEYFYFKKDIEDSQ